MLDVNLDYITLSFILAGVMALLYQKARSNVKYILASAVLGSICGIVFAATPALSDWSFVAAIIGTIGGAPTVIAWQGKTVTEIAKDIKSASEDVLDKYSSDTSSDGDDADAEG
jgi:O-antigen/teichoic acid export membrane protein